MMVYGFLDEHDERLLCEYMPWYLFVPGVHVFDIYFISRIRIHVKPATHINQFCSIEFFGPLQSLILLQQGFSLFFCEGSNKHFWALGMHKYVWA